MSKLLFKFWHSYFIFLKNKLKITQAAIVEAAANIIGKNITFNNDYEERSYDLNELEKGLTGQKEINSSEITMI